MAMILKAEVKRNGSYWGVVVNGRVTVDRESFMVASRIADEINSGSPDISTECGEVADSIIRWFGGIEAGS